MTRLAPKLVSLDDIRPYPDDAPETVGAFGGAIEGSIERVSKLRRQVRDAFRTHAPLRPALLRSRREDLIAQAIIKLDSAQSRMDSIRAGELEGMRAMQESSRRKVLSLAAQSRDPVEAIRHMEIRQTTPTGQDGELAVDDALARAESGDQAAVEVARALLTRPGQGIDEPRRLRLAAVLDPQSFEADRLLNEEVSRLDMELSTASRRFSEDRRQLANVLGGGPAR